MDFYYFELVYQLLFAQNQNKSMSISSKLGNLEKLNLKRTFDSLFFTYSFRHQIDFVLF